MRSQPLPEPIDEHSSSTRAPRRRAPLAFVALLLALSVPFWLVGAAAERQLLPGLPMGALMAICPAVAASILVYREARTAGVARLLKRAFDHERIRDKVWYAPILLLMPAMTAVAYGVMRAAGVPLPAPQFPVLAVPVLFLAFFAAGVGEELGWSGYVTDVLQARWSALRTGVLVGLVWAAWHLVVLLQAHRPPAWIAAWALGTVALRVLTVWLYDNAGKSVFAAALFHAMQNVSWQLFPNGGSHWDPRFTAPVFALTAAIVTLAWGPRTLTRPRWNARALRDS